MEKDKSQLFWLKKLQSLLGVIPVGVFLCVHYSINSFAEKGNEAFTNSIELMRNLPLLVILETGGIFIPIILHAVIGLVIIYSCKPNMIKFPNFANINFTIQRISGVFLLIFISYHVWHLKFSHPEHEVLSAQIVHEKIIGNVGILIFYLLGVLVASHHLLNGLYNFAIKWGIASGENTRKWWAYICIALGLVMSGWGVHIWWMVLTRIG